MVLTRNASSLDITRLSGTIGGVVDGVDVARPLDAETAAAIRQALVEHKVVFFPGQPVEPAQLVALGRAFGELTLAHPVMPGLDGHPEVLEVDATRSREDPRYRDEYENDTWHADVTFMPTPPLGSLLAAKVVPPAGGDTVFADQQAAYQGLSAPMRTLVDGLACGSPRRHVVRALPPDQPRRRRLGRPALHRARAGRAPGGAHPSGVGSTRAVRQPDLHLPHRGDVAHARATRCCGCSTSTPRRPSTSCGTAGPRATSRSGTTARRFTTPCATTAEHHRLMHRVTIRGDRPV